MLCQKNQPALELSSILENGHLPPQTLPFQMSEIFNRFSLQAAKFNGQVWLCIGVIWLIVLACTIASIREQPFSIRQQRFWIFAVIFVPIFGLLAYLPFSFRREQLAQFFFIHSQRDRPKKGVSAASRSEGSRTA